MYYYVGDPADDTAADNILALRDRIAGLEDRIADLVQAICRFPFAGRVDMAEGSASRGHATGLCGAAAEGPAGHAASQNDQEYVVDAGRCKEKALCEALPYFALPSVGPQLRRSDALVLRPAEDLQQEQQHQQQPQPQPPPRPHSRSDGDASDALDKFSDSCIQMFEKILLKNNKEFLAELSKR